MELKNTIKAVEGQFTKQKQTKISIAWFWTEIAIMTLYVSVSIVLFWKYVNIPMTYKFVITTLTGIIIYDIYKTFTYVRYLFIKEQQE